MAPFLYKIMCYRLKSYTHQIYKIIMAKVMTSNVLATDQYIKIPIWLIKMTSKRENPIYLTPFEQQLYCLIKGLSSATN